MSACTQINIKEGMPPADEALRLLENGLKRLFLLIFLLIFHLLNLLLKMKYIRMLDLMFLLLCHQIHFLFLILPL